jgi:1-acyl-sn-glycerol-3-phosphate acyltransferase
VAAVPCPRRGRRVQGAARHGDTEAIKTAVELVRSGEVVVMFPEGTRQRRDCGRNGRAAAVGRRTHRAPAGAPLVPAAIKGTDRLSRLAKLKVAYGEPFEPGDGSTRRDGND